MEMSVTSGEQPAAILGRTATTNTFLIRKARTGSPGSLKISLRAADWTERLGAYGTRFCQGYINNSHSRMEQSSQFRVCQHRMWPHNVHPASTKRAESGDKEGDLFSCLYLRDVPKQGSETVWLTVENQKQPLSAAVTQSL